jgi:hypothetical protein
MSDDDSSQDNDGSSRSKNSDINSSDDESMTREHSSEDKKERKQRRTASSRASIWHSNGHRRTFSAAALAKAAPVERRSKALKSPPPGAQKKKSTGLQDDPIVLSDDEDISANVQIVYAEIPPNTVSSPSLVTPSKRKPVAMMVDGERRVSSESSSTQSSVVSSVGLETPPAAHDPNHRNYQHLRKSQTNTSTAVRRLHYDAGEVETSSAGPATARGRTDSDEDVSSDEQSSSSSSDDSSDYSDDDSVDSQAEADQFYCSPPPANPYSNFSLKDFQNLWRLCEKNIGEKTEDIENGRLIRQANSRMVSQDTRSQSKAQYGRILPKATHKLLEEILQVQKTDVFVDVGHGIGNAVLQAAYTMGCESKGIEVVGDRNSIARVFQKELAQLGRSRHEIFDDPRRNQVGSVELRHGRLELPKFRDFITNPGRVTKAFVNNFDGVFAERSAKLGQKYLLDHFIAGLFALMEPGSVMVTLHPLALGHSLNSANELRRRHGMEESDFASFFQSETVTLGEAKDVVSWSHGGSNRKPIQVYVYRRIHQPNNGAAVFLCNNPQCEKAHSVEPQTAVGVVDINGEGDRVVISECTCGIAARPLRQRRRRPDEEEQWPYVRFS